MRRVSRNGGKTWYIVIAEEGGSVAVVSMFDYADEPGPQRQLLLWWDLDRCLVDGEGSVETTVIDPLRGRGDDTGDNAV